jgi:peptidyl-prolyl cis-trans isomerase C
MANFPDRHKSKMQSFLCFTLYALLFCVACSLGCRQKALTEIDANTPADNAVVTVNGIDITESELEVLVKQQLERVTAKAKQLPPNFTEQYKKQLRQWAIGILINKRLLDEQIKQADIVVTEEEVIAQIMSAAPAQEPTLTLEEFKKRLEKYGQNFELLKQQVLTELAYRKFMEAQWAGKINVTEDEARNYYSENREEFEIPEQVRASHILIKPDISEPGSDPNEAKAIAKAKTEDLLKQIQAGADFAELAKANSACPSAANGGDLNFFTPGQMVAPFEKAAFELQPGQISDIVETRFGYHIIKVTDHKDESVTPFDQAKDDVINKLTLRKQAEFTQEYIASLKEKADIVYQDIKTSPAKTATPSKTGD